MELKRDLASSKDPSRKANWCEETPGVCGKRMCQERDA